MSKNTERSLALVPTDASGRGMQPHKVAPFLQKLYQMVSDPESQHLLRWSDSGDSIIISDRDRLAKEVLPKWFKHNNYPTLVRQLNMYGFRKIPRLHQGALIGSGDGEAEDYENEYFKRGQPDLLAFIVRKGGGKKDGKGKEVDVLSDDAEGAGEGGEHQDLIAGSQSAAPLTVASVVSSIADIRRHQTALSAELNSLRQENQALWQEALHSREVHQRQQETINKIMVFLAGVFGGNTTRERGIMPSQRGGSTGEVDAREELTIRPEELGDAFLDFSKVGTGTGNQPASSSTTSAQIKPRKRRRLSDDGPEGWERRKEEELHGDASGSGKHFVRAARRGRTARADAHSLPGYGRPSSFAAHITVMDDNSSNASSPPDTTSLFGSMSPASEGPSGSPVMSPRSVASDSTGSQSLSAPPGSSSSKSTSEAASPPGSPRSATQSLHNPSSQQPNVSQHPTQQDLSQTQSLGIMQRAQEYPHGENWQAFFNMLNLGVGPSSDLPLMPTFSNPASPTLETIGTSTPTSSSVGLSTPTQLHTPLIPPLSPYTQVPIASPVASPSTIPIAAPFSGAVGYPSSSTALVSQPYGVPLPVAANLSQQALAAMQSTADLEARIDSTQASIDELVANLGLDPTLLAGMAGAEHSLGAGDVVAGPSSSRGGLSAPTGTLNPNPAAPSTSMLAATDATSGHGGQMDLDEFMKLLGEMK